MRGQNWGSKQLAKAKSSYNQDLVCAICSSFLQLSEKIQLLAEPLLALCV